MPTIDADAHVIETDRTWEYVEGPDAKFRPALVSANDGKRQFWFIDGKIFSRGVNINKEIPGDSLEMRDIQARLKHMDELKVDIQVLYPSLFLRPLTGKPEVETVLCRSYNRWLADIFLKGDRRLRWVAVLPLMTMDQAILEARFAKQSGACGLFMRGLVDDKLLSDSYFYPLYDEASRLNLPICVHASTGNFDWVELFQRESGFSKFKLPVLSAFHSIVSDRIPDTFPNLRFGFIEVSAQWVPYLYRDLVRRRQRRGESLEKNFMAQKRLYVACQTDDELPYILKYAGENNLVIGSDYGHADTSSEIEALRELKLNGEVSPEIVDKILHDNPKALYGL